MKSDKIKVSIGDMFAPLNLCELEALPFRKMTYSIAGRRMLVGTGYVHTSVDAKYAGLHTMALRKDGTITYSVKSNPGRMYSIPIERLGKWLLPTSKKLIKILGKDFRIAMQLDCLDSLIDSLAIEFDPYQGYKLLEATNAIDIMQYLRRLSSLHPTEAVLSKSLGRRLITTLKRLNVIEYSADSKSKFIYSGPYMDEDLCEWTAKRQLFVHSK